MLDSWFAYAWWHHSGPENRKVSVTMKLEGMVFVFLFGKPYRELRAPSSTFSSQLYEFIYRSRQKEIRADPSSSNAIQSTAICVRPSFTAI